jgi:hypothetical protein
MDGAQIVRLVQDGVQRYTDELRTVLSDLNQTKDPEDRLLYDTWVGMGRPHYTRNWTRWGAESRVDANWSRRHLPFVKFQENPDEQEEDTSELEEVKTTPEHERLFNLGLGRETWEAFLGTKHHIGLVIFSASRGPDQTVLHTWRDQHLSRFQTYKTLSKYLWEELGLFQWEILQSDYFEGQETDVPDSLWLYPKWASVAALLVVTVPASAGQQSSLETIRLQTHKFWNALGQGAKPLAVARLRNPTDGAFPDALHLVSGDAYASGTIQPNVKRFEVSSKTDKKMPVSATGTASSGDQNLTVSSDPPGAHPSWFLLAIETGILARKNRLLERVFDSCLNNGQTYKRSTRNVNPRDTMGYLVRTFAIQHHLYHKCGRPTRYGAWGKWSVEVEEKTETNPIFTDLQLDTSQANHQQVGKWFNDEIESLEKMIELMSHEQGDQREREKKSESIKDNPSKGDGPLIRFMYTPASASEEAQTNAWNAFASVFESSQKIKPRQLTGNMTQPGLGCLWNQEEGHCTFLCDGNVTSQQKCDIPVLKINDSTEPNGTSNALIVALTQGKGQALNQIALESQRALYTFHQALTESITLIMQHYRGQYLLNVHMQFTGRVAQGDDQAASDEIAAMIQNRAKKLFLKLGEPIVPVMTVTDTLSDFVMKWERGTNNEDTMELVHYPTSAQEQQLYISHDLCPITRKLADRSNGANRYAWDTQQGNPSFAEQSTLARIDEAIFTLLKRVYHRQHLSVLKEVKESKQTNPDARLYLFLCTWRNRDDATERATEWLFSKCKAQWNTWQSQQTPKKAWIDFWFGDLDKYSYPVDAQMVETVRCIVEGVDVGEEASWSRDTSARIHFQISTILDQDEIDASPERALDKSSQQDPMKQKWRPDIVANRANRIPEAVLATQVWDIPKFDLELDEDNIFFAPQFHELRRFMLVWMQEAAILCREQIIDKPQIDASQTSLESAKPDTKQEVGVGMAFGSWKEEDKSDVLWTSLSVAEQEEEQEKADREAKAQGKTISTDVKLVDTRVKLAWPTQSSMTAFLDNGWHGIVCLVVGKPDEPKLQAILNQLWEAICREANYQPHRKILSLHVIRVRTKRDARQVYWTYSSYEGPLRFLILLCKGSNMELIRTLIQREANADKRIHRQVIWVQCNLVYSKSVTSGYVDAEKRHFFALVHQADVDTDSATAPRALATRVAKQLLPWVEETLEAQFWNPEWNLNASIYLSYYDENRLLASMIPTLVSSLYKCTIEITPESRQDTFLTVSNVSKKSTLLEVIDPVDQAVAKLLDERSPTPEVKLPYILMGSRQAKYRTFDSLLSSISKASFMALDKIPASKLQTKEIPDWNTLHVLDLGMEDSDWHQTSILRRMTGTNRKRDAETKGTILDPQWEEEEDVHLIAQAAATIVLHSRTRQALHSLPERRLWNPLAKGPVATSIGFGVETGTSDSKASACWIAFGVWVMNLVCLRLQERDQKNKYLPYSASDARQEPQFIAPGSTFGDQVYLRIEPPEGKRINSDFQPKGEVSPAQAMSSFTITDWRFRVASNKPWTKLDSTFHFQCCVSKPRTGGEQNPVVYLEPDPMNRLVFLAAIDTFVDAYLGSEQ